MPKSTKTAKKIPANVPATSAEPAANAPLAKAPATKVAKVPEPVKAVKPAKPAKLAKPVKPAKPAKPEADPRFPIGKFAAPSPITPKDLAKAIDILAEMPKHLKKSLKKLSDKKLDTPYREGGWTVRQLVHHIADSHSTALFRIHKALTEESPLVAGYNEAAFATLADSAAPVKSSLAILEGTHARWVILLKSLKPADFERTLNHAERGPMTIAFVTMMYAWHAKHHVAHIAALRKHKDW